jgi:hypothetical protein
VTQVPASMTNLFIPGNCKVAPAARTILSIPNVCGVSYLLTKGKWSSWETNELLPLFQTLKRLFSIFRPMQQPTVFVNILKYFNIFELFIHKTKCCKRIFSKTAALILVLPTSTTKNNLNFDFEGIDFF